MRLSMTQESKELLLKDLCARLPYGVKVDRLGNPKKLLSISPKDLFCIETDSGDYMPDRYSLGEIKPYLRHLSSMTLEEKSVYEMINNNLHVATTDEDNEKILHYLTELLDYLKANHFDYLNLIEKNLAIEVTKDNNPYKN